MPRSFLWPIYCSSLDEVPPDIKKAPEEVTNVPFGRYKIIKRRR